MTDKYRYYTTKELVKICNRKETCITATIRALGLSFVKDTETRTNRYPEETMEKLRKHFAIIDHDKKNRRALSESKEKAEKLAEFEKAEDHLLVIDKRLLQTSYFPDVVPVQFKEMDADED